MPPADAAALSRAIGDVLADPADSARMGAAARRTVETRYTMERVAEMWMAAYNEVRGRRS